MSAQAKTLVSIINWNNNRATAACLESIARQPKEDQPDIYLIDNHSEQEKFDIPKSTLNKLRSVSVIRNTVNKGFAGAHNQALRHALEHNYGFVCLLNNDTEIIDAQLFNTLEAALVFSDNAIAAAPTILRDKMNKVWYAGGHISPAGAVSHEHVGVNAKDLPANELRAVSFLTGCCLMIDVKTLRRFGQLLEEDYFVYWEDADWCVRARNAGFDLLYVPASQILHNISSSLGLKSPLYIYYVVRNNILFIKRHVAFIYRPLAYLRVMLVSCKYILITLLQSPSKIPPILKALWFGWVDGLHKRSGQVKGRLI